MMFIFLLLICQQVISFGEINNVPLTAVPISAQFYFDQAGQVRLIIYQTPPQTSVAAIIESAAKIHPKDQILILADAYDEVIEAINSTIAAGKPVSMEGAQAILVGHTRNALSDHLDAWKPTLDKLREHAKSTKSTLTTIEALRDYYIEIAKGLRAAASN